MDNTVRFFSTCTVENVSFILYILYCNMYIILLEHLGQGSGPIKKQANCVNISQDGTRRCKYGHDGPSAIYNRQCCQNPVWVGAWDGSCVILKCARMFFKIGGI